MNGTCIIIVQNNGEAYTYTMNVGVCVCTQYMYVYTYETIFSFCKGDRTWNLRTEATDMIQQSWSYLTLIPEWRDLVFPVEKEMIVGRPGKLS